MVVNGKLVRKSPIVSYGHLRNQIDTENQP